MAFSATALEDAIKTVGQQAVPASFSERGQRIWRGQEEVIRRAGLERGRDGITASAAWGIFWFDPSERMYCLSHPDTLMSGLDPFRFMLRRAHVQGTDLRLFVSPFHASVRRIMDAAGLAGRFEFWLRGVGQDQRGRGRARRSSAFPFV